jgi:hypothetical protein
MMAKKSKLIDHITSLGFVCREERSVLSFGSKFVDAGGFDILEEPVMHLTAGHDDTWDMVYNGPTTEPIRVPWVGMSQAEVIDFAERTAAFLGADTRQTA